MKESEAVALVDEWDLDPEEYDTNGCIEDLMDGMDPSNKDEILRNNRYLD